jgi:hypothetical protein
VKSQLAGIVHWQSGRAGLLTTPLLAGSERPERGRLRINHCPTFPFPAGTME